MLPGDTQRDLFARLVAAIRYFAIFHVPLAQMCKVDERHSAKQEHQQEIGLHALQLFREHVKVCVHQSAHLFFRQCPFDL